MRAEAQLREKEQQYRSVFETTSDGLVINDLESGLVVEANPAFCRMHGFTYQEMIGRDPHTFIDPGSHGLFAAYTEVALAGRTFDCRAMDVRKDGTRFHVEVHGAPLTYRGRPCVLGVVRDISDRVRAYEELEALVAEHTRELTSLLDISQTMTSTLELSPLLRLILDQLKTVADYTAAAVLVVDGDDLLILDARWEDARMEAQLGVRFPVQRFGSWEILHAMREPAIAADLQSDEPLARFFRQVVGDLIHEEPYRHFRSWLGVPLIRQDRFTGMLALATVVPNYYTPRHARLALAFANQVAVTIENARLYEQAQRVAALEEQAAALRARHQLTVASDLGEEPAVSLEVKHDLYRIAREALHNTVKHARATHVVLRLTRDDGALVLEVQDDGTGFDAGRSFPGHLGLRSMRERAARRGGRVEIDSAPGRGTRIRARLPV
jgi:PAS domain S-box-containing protein